MSIIIFSGEKYDWKKENDQSWDETSSADLINFSSFLCCGFVSLVEFLLFDVILDLHLGLCKQPVGFFVSQFVLLLVLDVVKRVQVSETDLDER